MVPVLSQDKWDSHGHPACRRESWGLTSNWLKSEIKAVDLHIIGKGGPSLGTSWQREFRMRTRASVVKELEWSKRKSLMSASPAFIKVGFLKAGKLLLFLEACSGEPCAQFWTSYFRKDIVKSKRILMRGPGQSSWGTETWAKTSQHSCGLVGSWVTRRRQRALGLYQLVGYHCSLSVLCGKGQSNVD